MRPLLALLLAAALLADDAEHVRGLVERLGAEDVAAREAAQAELIAMGAAALPALQEALSHADPEVRTRAEEVLHELRFRMAWARLGAATPEERLAALSDVRLLAGARADAILEERAGPELVPVLEDVILYLYEPTDRKAAVELLARIGGQRTYPALLWALRDKLGHLGSPATQAIKQVADPTILPDLEAMASDDATIQALRVELVERLKEAPVPEKTWKAHDPASFVALAVEGKIAVERIRGVRAIVTGNLTGEHALGALAKSLSDADEAVRLEGAQAATYQADASLTAPLVGALEEDGSLRVRQMAAVALGKRSGDASQKALLAALGDAEAAVRNAVASALGDIGDAEVAKALEARLADEKDEGVRAQLQTSRTRIGERLK